jgi:hypothetical protein
MGVGLPGSQQDQQLKGEPNITYKSTAQVSNEAVIKNQCSVILALISGTSTILGDDGSNTFGGKGPTSTGAQ